MMGSDCLDDGGPDWPSEGLGKRMIAFESLLRCPICDEFLDNALVLECGHLYCSLCIRYVCFHNHMTFIEIKVVDYIRIV
jgi:hypothetical protein